MKLWIGSKPYRVASYNGDRPTPEGTRAHRRTLDPHGRLIATLAIGHISVDEARLL